MASNQTGDGRSITRRATLASLAGAGTVAIAGCSSGGSGNGESSDSSNGESSESGSSGSAGPTTLEAGGSSTVYPVSEDGAKYWNGNRPASDTEYWPHSEYGIETEKNLADYFAGLYGFEPGEGGDPPFNFSVALSHSGTGVEKVRDGKLDIGNSSGNVEAELPDRDSYEKFTDHVVAVDGQPLVVSQEIAEAGLESITGQQLKDLYKGRITNWQDIDSSLPDKDIQVLGRVKGSGTRTSFVSNVFDDPKADTSVANRFGQNQRLAQAVADADNAISYLALAFINTSGLAPVALNWEGTTYAYKDPQNGLDSKEYPLSRDLHMYTWDGTSMKEAALINMMLTDFGQDLFVEPNNYFTLGERRREEQRNKLPDQNPV
ncbi:MAG: phosphate ABC transporter substrate-binding protein, PhoT family [uncultured archaeon A07HN63]|nr:MAG: phosphate ABC transporter substrate-binding protein, PhoT family [uncultured archaeon A07HN63]